MKLLTEDQVRAIVREEMQKNYMSGSPDIPPHSHNGTDNLNVSPIDLVGFSALPSTNAKNLNTWTGGYQFGVASQKQLVQASASKAAQYIADSSIASYPLPIIFGVDDGGSPPQAEFQGGFAPEGTAIIFCALNNNTVKNLLYVRAGGRWLGAELTDFIA